MRIGGSGGRGEGRQDGEGETQAVVMTVPARGRFGSHVILMGK